VIEIRPPKALTPKQMAEVVCLVESGGEVRAKDLAHNLSRCHLIGTTVQDDATVCVAAIKRPASHYVQKIAKQSEYALHSAGAEFGYVVTHPDFRSRKLAGELSNALLSSYPGSVFATCRLDNIGIIKILSRNGFAHVGKPYPSFMLGRALITLWIRG